jgi:hypothetical protein
MDGWMDSTAYELVNGHPQMVIYGMTFDCSERGGGHFRKEWLTDVDKLRHGFELCKIKDI